MINLEKMARFMNKFRFILLSLVLVPQLVLATDPEPKEEYLIFDEEVIKERVLAMESAVVKPRFTRVVKGYIKGYTIRNRAKAEGILGRSILYFPIFENYLKEKGYPIELKYLPVLESALTPRARSRVGAKGLWQFMPYTAKESGLRINRYIDERCDPHKSTKAALEYLNKQYERYGDWALALAAYNGGPGRVSRAIKRSRSKNFWRLKRYLPRETRNYVPAFIAASYLMEHYDAHGLQPDTLELDMQLTETLKVYEYHSFYRIAQLTGLSIEMIESLNPAYLRGFIPSNPSGNYLTLPKRVMQAFVDYRDSLRPDQRRSPLLVSEPVVANKSNKNSNKNYRRIVYTVKSGEDLATIALQNGVTTHQLKHWNKLESFAIVAGQKIVIFQPKEFKRFSPRKEIPVMSILPGLPLTYVSPKTVAPFTIKEEKQRFRYYIVEEKERPSQIAEKIQGISAKEIIRINKLKGNRKIKPGTILLLKQVR